MTNNHPNLDNIPSDVQKLIAEHLDPIDIVALATVSRSLNGSIKEKADAAIRAELSRREAETYSGWENAFATLSSQDSAKRIAAELYWLPGFPSDGPSIIDFLERLKNANRLWNTETGDLVPSTMAQDDMLKLGSEGKLHHMNAS